ncbi:helix-turn-helix transcriptional regulator [Nocardioides speluncae]|uniref:helix-turn-helix transcriptional regulator n=1 Tax=Nocardioides speluncae TaxID=2670337 RepID=UPI0012B186CD|nr:hypothetical protein [Nocardioides speluncae]
MTHKFPPGTRFHLGLPYPKGHEFEDGIVWAPLVAERFFAGNLRLEREARGMTQAALARLMASRDVPLSQSAVAKLEREDDATRRPLRLFEAAALAQTFDRTVDDMCLSVAPLNDEHRDLLEAERQQQTALRDQVAAAQQLAQAEAAVAEANARVDTARERFAGDGQHQGS